MKLLKCSKIPTGFLFTSQGQRGELETLSIGDYGKEHNIKADFLGFHKEINGVPNQPTKPMSEKWVVTLSTQYGCPQKCIFCDVPKIPFKGNASFDDLLGQLQIALLMFPHVAYTDRLNIHFARMGEPTYNKDVLEFAYWLYNEKAEFQRLTGLRCEVIHPVLTTSAPMRFKHLAEVLQEWCHIKNDVYKGQAGLQLSINSTNEEQRQHMFQGESITLEELAKLCEKLPPPIGRKYCLNFAYSTDFQIDAVKLASLFSRNFFMVKITPIHNNTSCRVNKIQTLNGYDSYQPYRIPEEALKKEGFDVIVFVPSMDEENGLVTCGNLALSK